MFILTEIVIQTINSPTTLTKQIRDSRQDLRDIFMALKLQVGLVATIFKLWVDSFYCILCSVIRPGVCILEQTAAKKSFLQIMLHTKSHDKRTFILSYFLHEHLILVAKSRDY